MLDADIEPGDILVVDKSLPASHGKIVVAAVNGELTVKRLQDMNDQTALLPENKAYKPVEINDHSDVHIWGVVTNVIKAVYNGRSV